MHIGKVIWWAKFDKFYYAINPTFVPSRRYASAGIIAVIVCPSVCHTPVLYQNG